MDTTATTLVIIINYHTSHLIKGLLDSIDEDETDIQILVLDNESTVETFSELEHIVDDRMLLLRSKTNLGFTGGINFALDHAIKTGINFKYFFLINPDATCYSNVIGGLIRLLEDSKNGAAISPRIINTSGKPGYSGAHIDYNKGKVLTRVPIDADTSNEIFEVDAYTGCAVLLDKDKVIEAGLFNEDLFMYYDEAELCMRLTRLGYKIYYAPKYYVIHDLSYTTRKNTFIKTYYMTRNKFIVFSKSMSFYNKISFAVHEFAFHVKNRRLKDALYHLKGIYDFAIGKKGNLFSTHTF
jgi:GT2 family glycosyltransferase